MRSAAVLKQTGLSSTGSRTRERRRSFVGDVHRGRALLLLFLGCALFWVCAARMAFAADPPAFSQVFQCVTLTGDAPGDEGACVGGEWNYSRYLAAGTYVYSCGAGSAVISSYQDESPSGCDWGLHQWGSLSATDAVWTVNDLGGVGFSPWSSFVLASGVTGGQGGGSGGSGGTLSIDVLPTLTLDQGVAVGGAIFLFLGFVWACRFVMNVMKSS